MEAANLMKTNTPVGPADRLFEVPDVFEYFIPETYASLPVQRSSKAACSKQRNLHLENVHRGLIS